MEREYIMFRALRSIFGFKDMRDFNAKLKEDHQSNTSLVMTFRQGRIEHDLSKYERGLFVFRLRANVIREKFTLKPLLIGVASTFVAARGIAGGVSVDELGNAVMAGAGTVASFLNFGKALLMKKRVKASEKFVCHLFEERLIETPEQTAKWKERDLSAEYARSAFERSLSEERKPAVVPSFSPSLRK